MALSSLQLQDGLVAPEPGKTPLAKPLCQDSQSLELQKCDN